MLYPEYRYVGFKSDVHEKTQIGDLNDLVIPSVGEFYTSIYRFNSDILRYPSLADLDPSTLGYADFLVIDLDNRHDLTAAYSDCKVVCNGLADIGAAYSVWFSGNKGFHIYVPTSQFGFEPTADTTILKRMAEGIAQGVKSFDASVYNKTRIFRYPNTQHAESGLYKVEGGAGTLDLLLEGAKTPGTTGICAEGMPFNAELKALYDHCKVKINRTVQERQSNWHGSIFVKAGEGQRNETAYTVARKLARRGIPQADVQEIMREVWNKKFVSAPLPEGELKKVVSNSFKGGMNELVEEGSYGNHIYDISRALEETRTTFAKIGHNCFYTGYPFLDEVSMGFYPGEVIIIAARSGNYKTCVLENILQRGSAKAQKPALMFSMEMPSPSLTLRRVQKSLSLSKKEALDCIRKGGDLSKAEEDWAFIKTCHLSNLGTEEILGLIDYYVETHGGLSAIGIDYLGLTKGANNNREKTARMATDLKTRVGRAAECPVFCLTQAKQIYEGRDGDVELDRTCGKDSDTILDSADYGIGMWGHWSMYEGQETRFVFGRILKDRGMDDETYKPRPYFGLDIDAKTMNLRDIIYVPDPPTFKQKAGSKEDE